MAFEWKDKRDGVDDILADDINGMAHAIIEGLTAIAKINKPAGVYKTDISLLDLENETNEENVVIKAKSVDLGTTGTAKFYVSGHIRFTTKGEYGIHTPTVKVDEKTINSNEVGTDKDGYVLYAYEFDGDIAESIELITSGSYTYVEFETLCKIEEKNGLMTGKQAEKLENTYTKDESNELFAKNKVASATTKEPTLEQLYNEGKANGLGTVNGNKWTSIGADSFTINVQGKVSFSGVTKSEYMKIYIDGKEFEGSEFNGIVQDKIRLYHNALSSGFIEFSYFSITQYTGGLMSGEDKRKLENTPTKEEVDNLIAEAFGTVEAVFDEVHEYAESLGGDEA